MVNTFPGPFVFQSLEMLKHLHKVAVNRLGKIGPEPSEPTKVRKKKMDMSIGISSM